MSMLRIGHDYVDSTYLAYYALIEMQTNAERIGNSYKKTHHDAASEDNDSWDLDSRR